MVVLGASGQEEEGNTVGAIPGQAGRDYPNFQVSLQEWQHCKDDNIVMEPPRIFLLAKPARVGWRGCKCSY